MSSQKYGFLSQTGMSEISQPKVAVIGQLLAAARPRGCPGGAKNAGNTGQSIVISVQIACTHLFSFSSVRYVC